MNIRHSLLAVVSASVLVACGGGGGSNTSAAASPGLTASAGALTDAVVKGVCYLSSPSGSHGSTTASGGYSYSTGDSIEFWINTDGSGCGSTPATSSSTSGISLGSFIPNAPTGTTQNTFILSLSTGAQAAETLNALNIGSASAMDVTGVTLPTSNVSDINAYVSSYGNSTGTSSSVGSLFTAAQGAAKVGATTISPVLPVTATFRKNVLDNIGATASNGLGAAPSNFSIPVGTLVFAASSGVTTPTGGVASAPSPAGVFNYFGPNGIGSRAISVNSPSFTVTPSGSNPNMHQAILPLTYTVNGNTITLSASSYDVSNALVSTAQSVQTVTYFDGKNTAYTATQSSYAAALPSSPTSTSTRVGSNVRLTPLTNAMLANRVVTLQVPRCGGTATLTFDSAGSLGTYSCGGTLTFTQSTDIPGAILVTSAIGAQSGNDGSIFFVGLDGASVAKGSALYFVTENPGTTTVNYMPYGRFPIVAVQ